MPAVPSQLTSLDFFEIKESIRSYLRTRKEFTDYDFEGSAASYLIDILAYNTYYTAFNANMALNESFLETATVRDNIVKIAKQLNYTPRSIKAPKACLDMVVQTSVSLNGVTFPEFVTLKKGDVFVADNNLDSYTFALLNDIQVPVDKSNGQAMFMGVIVYQGNLLNYNYTVDYTKNQEYIIPAENVDTELLTVKISPNAQSEETDTYNIAGNVTSLDSNSRVYYLEETDDFRYKIIFGDGVLGRQLIDGEYIQIDYITTFGVEANGADNFAFVGNIVDSDGRVLPPQAISTTTREKAQQGEVAETPLQIKFRAPRSYATQNRAVTEADYEHIVSEIYPQAASVTAYGGEKLTPPVYGKVYVAVRPKTGNKLNESTKKKIENDLKKYTVASIQPEVIDPTSFYMIPKTYAYYNGNDTNLTGSQLGTKILQSIDDFNRAGQSNRFGGRLETSKFGAMVDNADTAISGNVTQMALGQNLDKFTFGNVFTQCLDFGNPIYDPNDYSGNSDGNGDNGGDGDGDGTGGNGDGNGNGDGTGGKCNPSFSTVKSGTFYATGYTEDLVNLTASGGGAAVSNDTVFSSNEENQVLVPVNIRDDGKGNLMLVTTRDESEVILNATVGTVDYGSGQVCVGPLAIQQTPSGEPELPISVMPFGGSIEIPPGVDPTIFNPKVNPIDYTINKVPVPNFDPNNFSGYNLGDTSGINIIDYPTDTFTYPVDTSCF
tara:strand:+ start:9746 stop:11902 length:2157 start_codon:yes stop_codon:yes gene_type:complete